MTPAQHEIIRVALGLCQSEAEDASAAASFNGSMHDPGDRLIALVGAYRAGMAGAVPDFLQRFMPEAERIAKAKADPEFALYQRLHAKFGGRA